MSCPLRTESSFLTGFHVAVHRLRISKKPIRKLLPSDQHDSEASFVSHHPSVSFGSLCQRNGFDHRTDLLQGQESVSSASIAEPVMVSGNVANHSALFPGPTPQHVYPPKAELFETRSCSGHCGM